MIFDLNSFLKCYVHPKDTFLIDLQYVLANFHSYYFFISLDFRVSLSFLWLFRTACIGNVELHKNVVFLLRFLLLLRGFIQHGLGKLTLLTLITVFFSIVSSLVVVLFLFKLQLVVTLNTGKVQGCDFMGPCHGMIWFCFC